jgi:hypothetical protein
MANDRRHFPTVTAGILNAAAICCCSIRRPQEDIEKLPDPDSVYASYSDWVKKIREKSAVYLPPVPTYNKQTIIQIKSSLDFVVQAVKKAKDDMFDRVPA